MSGITWLASYPKSGNTWLRVFLTNLRRDEAAPVNINDLDLNLMAVDRDSFDRIVGYEAGALAQDEVDLLRPDVYRYQAGHAEDPCFCKVHDAYIVLPDGQALFPLEATVRAIYLIRNPLDVCVSFAHQHGTSGYDVTISLMANPRFSLAGRPNQLNAELRQRLLTWSDHVRSWVDAPNLPIHVIRYEDMKTRPVETFTAAAAFIGMRQDRATIERALKFSSIEELQRQEHEHGFREANGPKRMFFRKGKVGSWREELTTAQVSRIISDHKDVMSRLGYLTEAGEPAS